MSRKKTKNNSKGSNSQTNPSNQDGQLGANLIIQTENSINNTNDNDTDNIDSQLPPTPSIPTTPTSPIAHVQRGIDVGEDVEENIGEGDEDPFLLNDQQLDETNLLYEHQDLKTNSSSHTNLPPSNPSYDSATASVDTNHMENYSASSLSSLHITNPSSIISNIVKPTPKSAYEVQDPELSKKLHQEQSKQRKLNDIHHSEKHVGIGDVIKCIVFGGLDGIITTFAIVAACVGSQQSYATTLIVGFANLIGDAFAMGLGDFFSSRAEALHSRQLFKNYLWRVEKKPQDAKRVMRTIFSKKGFSEKESKRIVEYLSQNKEAFADIMLLELDGVCMEESTLWGPLKGGIVTFISFIIFGAVPIFPFAIQKEFDLKCEVLDWHFYLSCGLTALSLFFLGILKNILLHKNWLYGGTFMLIQGGISTIIAYGIGMLIEKLSQFIN